MVRSVRERYFPALLSPRKLFVTQDEHKQLVQLGIYKSEEAISEDGFVDAVSELTGLNRTILLSHCWKIEVVDEVTFRCGRSWRTRGTIMDKMSGTDKSEIEDAHKRAIESLVVPPK